MKLLVTVFALLSLTAHSFADIVMRIDISDPSNVKFISTDAYSQNTFLDLGNSFNGITLQNFFTSNNLYREEDLSTSIDVYKDSNASERGALARIWVGNYEGGWTLNDLSFYDRHETFTMSFFDDQIALVGSAEYDLSSFGGLPNVGDTGYLFAGELNAGNLIGQWEVVAPIPATTWLFLSAIGGLLSLKHRTRWNGVS